MLERGDIGILEGSLAIKRLSEKRRTSILECTWVGGPVISQDRQDRQGIPDAALQTGGCAGY